ncbi:MAG: hypothetical protein M1825_005617 [Sarcosagium campestre]|nr:MAG: hypothetical protein M1825_005617 [Sarcosagium campestre]
MSSAPMTPGTEAASNAGDSRLSSSPPSSPPSDISVNEDQFQNGDSQRDISDSMREEEAKMEKAAVKEEQKRQRKLKAEREKDSKGGAVLEKKFQGLEFLLSQSKVYAAIMTQNMQRDHAAAEAAETRQEKKKTKQREESKSVANAKPTRTSAKTRSSGGADSTMTESSPSSKLPSRTKPGKKSTIGDYFKKGDLEAKSGNASVAQALAEEAGQGDAKATAFGAQNLKSARQPDLVSGGTMRSYQLEGLEWLTTLYENGLNGILADEMGLGKTIQTISLIAFLRSKKTYGPFLIVAPLSTLSNWIEEFERWTPKIPTVLYHGSKAQREHIRKTRMSNQYSDKFPVVCTSYEICMNDRKFLADFNWKFIIIDEGHRLKNLNCRLIRELKTYKSTNRLLITGTPLQNNLSELWSLLNFLMPQIFDEVDKFESWFDFSGLQERDGHHQILDGERQNNILSSLHAILKPFLLRRVKADVETSLPKKREYVLYAPLSNTQKDLYREIRQGTSRDFLEKKAIERISSSKDTLKGSRSSSLKRKAASGVSTPNKSAKSSREATPATSVRKRKGKAKTDYREKSDREYFKDLEQANGPNEGAELDDDELVEVERAKTIAQARKEVSAKKLQNPIMQLRLCCNSPHNFYWPWDEDATPDSRIVTESGKMRLLDRLLPHLFKNGHKVLVFSQFKTQLDIIEDWASLVNGWNVCRIDGAVAQDVRRSQIKAFNSDASHRLFLLSTRAGGQGINLAAADTVILFDSDWNPQQDLQAQDRAHRIGQTRPVVVYRLATKGTVEQTLLEKADGKRRLEKLVIRQGRFKSLVDAASAPAATSRNQNASGGADDEDDEDKDDVDDLRKVLDEDDFENYELPDDDNGTELLSDRDLDILTDRSEEAYLRAEKGEGGGDGFRVVQTKKEGDNNTLVDAAGA